MTHTTISNPNSTSALQLGNVDRMLVLWRPAEKILNVGELPFPEMIPRRVLGPYSTLRVWKDMAPF